MAWPAGLDPTGGFAAYVERFDGSQIVKPLETLYTGRIQLRAWQSMFVRHWQVRTELARTASLAEVSYLEGDDRLAFQPPPAVTSVMVEMAPPWRIATVAVGMTVPDAGAVSPDLSARVWLQPVNSLGLGWDAGTLERWPTEWAALIEGEGGAVFLDGDLRRNRWITDFKPNPSWHITGKVDDVQLAADPPASGKTGEFTLQPTGLLLQRQLQVTHRPWPGGITFGFQMSNGDVTGQVRGYTEGLRFGQMGVLEATWHSWQLSAASGSRVSWTAAVSGGAAELFTSGVIKFWPFSEGLVELLGQRRHVEISGRVTWWQAGGGISVTPVRILRLEAGLDCYRIQPELSLFSWQPLLFGLGVSDPAWEQLEISRVDLGSLRVGTNWTPVRGIQLHVSARQWFPFAIVKTGPSQSGPSTPAPPSPAPAPSNTRHVGQGMVIAMGISVAW